MKIARLLGLAAILLTGVLFSVFASDDERTEYLEVKKPFPNIYVKLDPKSEIIRQAKPNERLEIINKGESGSWLKVRVDGKEGWVETKTGKIVNRKGASILMYILYVILLLGCMGAVVLYIKKQQMTVASDE